MNKHIITLFIFSSTVICNGQTINLGGGVSFSNTSEYDKDFIKQSSFAEMSTNYTTENTTGKYSDYQDRTSVIGFNLQAIFEQKLSEHTSLLSGLLLSTKGFKFEYQNISEESSLSSTNREKYLYEYSERYLYLDLPVGLKFDVFNRSNWKIYGNAGLYLGFGLTGKFFSRNEIDQFYQYNGSEPISYYELEETEDKIEITGPNKDMFYSQASWLGNAGLYGGIGVQFKNYFIDANCAYGLATLDFTPYSNNGKTYLMRRNFNITIGYSFPLRKEIEH